MAEGDIVERLASLFRETGDSHHRAFAETDGEDPEWPSWYADHLKDELPELLGADVTRSEIIHLLLLSEEQRSLEAPDEEWPRVYATYLAGRYGLR